MKPITWPAPSDSGKIEPYYGVPELNSATQGCVLDRIPVPCDMLANLKEAGGVVNQTLVRDKDGFWRYERESYESHGLGLFTNRPYQVVELGNGQKTNPQTPPQPAIDEPGVRSNVEKRLTDSCKEYIEKLLNEAARQNPKNPVVSTNLLQIFDDVQKQGGFHRLPVGTRKKPSLAEARGTIPGKNATVNLAPMKMYPDMTQEEITRGALALDSGSAFHELTHLAGSKKYDDIQLSRAARSLGGPPLPTAKTNENLDFSKYLENELNRNCPP